MEPTSRTEGTTDEALATAARHEPGVAAVAATDDATMTRSEERVSLAVQRRTYEVVRLRKVIVTEERTITVPVRREQLVVERVTVSDLPAPRGPGDDAALADHLVGGVVEMTLSEEEVVVETRVVPRERVRVSKQEVTVQRQVVADVRREQIDVERETLVAPVAGGVLPGGAQPGRTTTPDAST